MDLSLNRFPIATAFRAGLKNYTAKRLRDDCLAGLIVSLVALPLAMALSVAVGLPPQHGLYTAIVAGVLTALLGGSMTQVSGPTAAFVVIIAPIVSAYGLHGLIWCQIMAGFILIALGTFRLGKFIRLVPETVTAGFTAGIGVVIATLAINDFFGLGVAKLEGEYLHKASLLASHLTNTKWPELSVGMVTLLIIVLFPKIFPKIPSPIIGISVGAALAFLFNHLGFHVDTIGARFTYDTAEGVKQGIPPYPPVFHWPSLRAGEIFSVPTLTEFKAYLVPATTIAALAGLESLLAAVVGDKIAKTKHDPDAELNGIGIANIFSGLAAGIPATGAIARTATNIHAGAKTPVASAFHAILILFYILVFSSLISHVPMTALAALLIVTAYRMSHAHEFIDMLRRAPKPDVAVLLVCFTLTVLVDMVAGVLSGLLLAGAFHVRRKYQEKKHA